jgi:B9 domain-containing protein 2
MAELHVIGQISGASGFEDSALYCKWSLNTGSGWRLLQGDTDGQTQVDQPSYEMACTWSHPVDVHYATKGLQGWPKFNMQVWGQDVLGRTELKGYAQCQVPTTPGVHELKCATWRPIGSFKDQITSYFVGGGIELKNPELAISNSESYRLKTISMGIVHLKINVILRNFDKYGVEL